MNLWIRSQDKGFLTKVNNIELDAYRADFVCDEFRLYSYMNNDTSFLLGTYKTKKEH